MTEAYESENLVYLPTRAMVQVSSKRSYLSTGGQETTSYLECTYNHELKTPFKEKKSKSGKNLMGVPIF